MYLCEMYLLDLIIIVFVLQVLLYCIDNVKAFKSIDLKGRSLTLVFTPFDDDGNIILPVIDDYAAYLNSSNINALLIVSKAGEPYSLNKWEKQRIVEAWVNINRRKHYGFVLFVEVGYMTTRDSCEFAAYCEELKVDGIFYNTAMLDAGPKTPQHVVLDLKRIAFCAPSTPLFYEYSHISCRNTDVCTVNQLAADEIPSYTGMRVPIKQAMMVQACDNYTRSQIIVINCESILEANKNDFAGYSSPFKSIFVNLVNAIDNASTEEAAVAAQNRLNFIVKQLCGLRKHCRISCPMNVMKAMMEVKTGVRVGNTRAPLCPVTPSVIKDVTRLLREYGELP